MGPDDMVLCAGTLPREVAFAERLAVASAAGFRYISLWGRDIAAARAEGYADADLRSMLADHGLGVAEVDPAWWWLPGAAGVSIDPSFDTEDVFRFGEHELLAMAEAVGARSLNAVDAFGGTWSIDQAAEAFAGLCSRAAEHGLLVHIEWLPWSRIPDLTAARAVVEGAGATNGGLNIDAWHLVRAGVTLEELAAVPGDLVLGIQLDDGPLAAEANLVEATLHDRRLPGEGEFDLQGLVRTLAAIGTTAPLGVEVFSDELHRRGPAAAAVAAARSTITILEESR
ncbi:MAG TPA: TIM barrel protein [Acidimicrobiales bacterium]